MRKYMRMSRPVKDGDPIVEETVDKLFLGGKETPKTGTRRGPTC